jgi:hypothetical protein
MRTHVGAHAVRVLVSLLTAGAGVGVAAEAVAADRAGPVVPAVSFFARRYLIDVAAASPAMPGQLGIAAAFAAPGP